MSAPLEDWSLADHLRFLLRSAPWLIGAFAIAAGVAFFIAHEQVVTGEVLLQLGHNRVSGWVEPPNELVARLQAPGFLAEVADEAPGAPEPLFASQIPKSGYIRIRATGPDRALAAWTIEQTLDKLTREHDARADLAAQALAQRQAQLDRQIARLAEALEGPDSDDPALRVERLRAVKQLGSLERQRDDLRPQMKIASPPRSRAVQPAAYRVDTKGPKPAVYGGVAGFLLALTLIYLREGLRAPASTERS